ncbi:MAG: HPP family protein [Acinetobacter populi]|uniref:HPP family protein n=1 Tax=Acinetobacter populi TaxID=1582270 RepID=UPI002354992A|nr:HPP family protein [Acinetobacter populi]MCH4246635.1 HPP family protein [Acinetobacter populi]
MAFYLQQKKRLASFFQQSEVLRSLIGGTASILALLWLTQFSQHVWIMAPFGASCVILYAVSQSPLAQPRNVILGHFISALIGLLFLKFFSTSMLSIAFAVGCATAAMQLLKCVHPPAGANPLVILLTANTVQYDWIFLLFPTLSGAILLVLIACIVNNIGRHQKYPVQGFAWLKNKH